MDDQNKNLILASVLSFVVIIVWFVLFPPPEPIQTEEQNIEQTQTQNLPAQDIQENVTLPSDLSDNKDVPSIDIETDRVVGSISLEGGRIDNLSLKDYRVALDETAEIVTLLKPSTIPHAFYAAYGWAALAGLDSKSVPNPDTIWSVSGNPKLTPQDPVTIYWDNQNGLLFSRTISIDDNYLFTIDQTVTNKSGSEVQLRPYGLLRRHGEPLGLKNFFILHEGLVRMSDGTLAEDSYDDLRDYSYSEREAAYSDRIEVENSGWIGFTDHFWMATLIPEQNNRFRSTAKYYDKSDIFQAETVFSPQTVGTGQSASVTSYLFAGAKEWEAIRNYERTGVDGFLDSIDWGWFFFLTKPIFAALHYLNKFIGNTGWAIIGLTLLIKTLLLPLAYKSYVSMAKMKELQPEMEKIKERAAGDRQKLQAEMMELYKKEKVNPAAGCLPILLQIPIFFALYKVIFVTLELRHAPWIGWIKDLSAPDPSTILNLFGLLPWANPFPPESLLFIFSLGILPILLGISMWLQQKLNPAPTDATQAMIFAWMPWVFMFMLGTFASGLIIYWIANNMITFAQQYMIMRSQGYKPDVFGNIKASFKRKKT